MWACSLMVEHTAHNGKSVGSNPANATILLLSKIMLLLESVDHLNTLVFFLRLLPSRRTLIFCPNLAPDIKKINYLLAPLQLIPTH